MQGIIVGCDKAQEWLLPWWWQHYSAHNFYEVAFVDFGMTEKAIAWVSERGQYIKLPATAAIQELSPERRVKWICTLEQRTAWFKKPFACLHSPFPMSIWIDLDCEVRGSLGPLFNILALGADFAMVRDLIEGSRLHNIFKLPEYTVYNSGVLPFWQGASFLSLWVEETLHRSDTWFSDDDILSWIIHKGGSRFTELSAIYNWNAAIGVNPEAVMVHYLGDRKREIAKKLDALER